ncbi:dihydrofolate reductase [Muriicola jejuensis]|uniref:Dihydrofolate reductase n=1 Tax=Muriicola jejuensis TaxID=504488 RepID=A0A6P0UDS6_9FLAO|nr:dihydrofolate reductase [Muriicola jejuensis]NER09413.1 dihydrofolate reductase [Muriicola jejuensis]SMP08807.1 dihydrofolate reductase [Muriicola jejuensis]
MRNIIIIAAAAENNALGKDNDLLWHLPDDFKRFKAITTGHTIIMGRKTFESFPKPLPNRFHVIITRDRSYSTPHEKCAIVHSLKEAYALTQNEETVYIIGGGEIYAQAMADANLLELTRVHATYEADTFFPEIDPTQWELLKEELHPADERHAVPFTYQTYTRRQKSR